MKTITNSYTMSSMPVYRLHIPDENQTRQRGSPRGGPPGVGVPVSVGVPSPAGVGSGSPAGVAASPGVPAGVPFGGLRLRFVRDCHRARDDRLSGLDELVARARFTIAAVVVAAWVRPLTAS